MHRQMRFGNILLTILMILSMAIGETYVPVIAKESSDVTQSSLGNEDDATSEDIPGQPSENERNLPDSATEESESTGETGKAEETEESRNSDDTGEPKNIEGTEESKNTGDTEETEKTEEETPQDGKEAALDEDIGEEGKEKKEKSENDEKPEMSEIINVVVPVNYILALNPYSLPIQLGKDEIITEQVISGNYGIVNKSSSDQIVRISLLVEDMNEGELVFVDSAEEARNAEEGVYAVYLVAVPADGQEILVNGVPADENTTGESLQNVRMTGAEDKAVALYAGENQLAFKLSGAEYGLESDESMDNQGTQADKDDAAADDAEDTSEEVPEMILKGLAPDGRGVTAYTFSGAMNPNAAWENLLGGIKISVVYTYQTADGSEEIIEGTGAMVSVD